MKNLWLKFMAWVRLKWLHFLTRVMITQRASELEYPAKLALKRIVLEGVCPPDTVSMGVQFGGPAVFFTHDKGKEVFIGKSYEDAADRFLEWIRGVQARGEDYTPTTKTTTKLNRAHRRAFASKGYRNSQKKASKRK